MATKSTGVGRGGARPGAGRKPKADPVPTPPDLQSVETLLAQKSIEDLMDLAVRIAASNGRWDEVSKAGARLLNARARQATRKPAGGQNAADAPTVASRFAPRPPPPKPN